IREGEIEVSGTKFGGRTTSFAVRVAPLGSGVGGGGLVLLLAEDQTESRRVEEVRRDFVANVSHELKTPVGALALLAETVEDAADDPEAVRRFAGRMRQEASRLTKLAQDLITLSRIQAAEPIPDPIPVDLSIGSPRPWTGAGCGPTRTASSWRPAETPGWWYWATRTSWSTRCATCWRTRSHTARRTPAWWSAPPTLISA